MGNSQGWDTIVLLHACQGIVGGIVPLGALNTSEQERGGILMRLLDPIPQILTCDIGSRNSNINPASISTGGGKVLGFSLWKETDSLPMLDAKHTGAGEQEANQQHLQLL
jgi:hypothetical protein